MGTKTSWLTDNSPEGACAGRSLVEIIEDELDEVVDWLMENAAKQVGVHMPEQWDELQTKKGQALGLATAIAIIQAPYCPNVDSVRADSVRRYEHKKETRSSWSSAGSRAEELVDHDRPIPYRVKGGITEV